MKRTAILLATSLGMAGNCLAQRSSARTDFYAANPAHQARSWVGLKTSLVLRTDGGQNGCQFREVAEDFQFRQGDHFRVRLQSNASAYLYVVARDGQGSFRLLYPSGSGADATSQVGRFETRMIPERDWFAFDANAGQERMYIFMNAKPMKEFERLLANPSKPVKSGELQKLVDRADESAAGVAEESGPDGDVGATYSVSEVNWKSDPVLRRFRFQNYGR